VIASHGCGDGDNGLTIVNKSGQDLQGGDFQLFWDDDAGLRTEIPYPSFTTTYCQVRRIGYTFL